MVIAFTLPCKRHHINQHFVTFFTFFVTLSFLQPRFPCAETQQREIILKTRRDFSVYNSLIINNEIFY